MNRDDNYSRFEVDAAAFEDAMADRYDDEPTASDLADDLNPLYVQPMNTCFTCGARLDRSDRPCPFGPHTTGGAA